MTKLAELLLLKKKLELEKRLRYYIHPDSKWKMLYELLHTLVIIYSIFTIPLIVGFEVELNTPLLVIEVIILMEQITYPILQLRTPQYAYGILTLDFKILLQTLIEKGLIIELISLLPLNLIFGIFLLYFITFQEL